MIENLNLATNKELHPDVQIPDSDTYYLSPDEYNTLVIKIKELITAHNSLTNTVSGNISFMSIVFRRSNDEIIEKPTGGTFMSPLPTSSPQWTDGVPNGTAVLWASSRIFSSDGYAPQQVEWSTPSKMTDTSEFDVEFSNLEYVDESIPGNPTDNPANWSNSGNESSIWMATAIIKNGKEPLGSDWSIIRIKGENGKDGKDQEFIYTTIATPTEPYDISTLPASQETEYIPGSEYGIWTDDPQGVIPTKQFEWVAKRTRINGVWGRFSKPALWARYAIDGDGQSSFKSFVFKRSNIPPVTPTSGNGSFDSPLPDPIDGWTDYIPSGEQTLWVSSRMFSKDGFDPQEALWSTPTILADSSSLDVEFSKNVNPGNPTDNPENWSNVADEETIWMAIAKLKGGEIEGGWQISKIKGEGGSGVSVGTVYLYKRSKTLPSNVLPELEYNFSTNSFGEADLNGWTQEIPENNGDPIWIMFATISSLGFIDTITPSEWSTPVILTQDGGKTATVYLYQRSDTIPNPATPDTICEYYFESQLLDGTLGNWQQSFPETNGKPVWMIAATAYSSTSSDTIDIDDWSDPITLLRDGEDGPGYESIFKLTTDNVAPSTPNSEQSDDYIPSGWSDNPESISEVNKFCWVSKRSKKTNPLTNLKEWSAFSTPVIFSKYSLDGIDGEDGRDGRVAYSSSGMVYYGSASQYAPSPPSATSFNFNPPMIVGLSGGWDIGAPTYEVGQTNSYWYCTYSASDVDGDGIGTISFGPVTKAINFTGLVTFTSAGSISDGTNAIDFTAIDGGSIKTGTIASNNFVMGSDRFSNSGTSFDLSNGSIISTNFAISQGSAIFNGVIEAATLSADLNLGNNFRIYTNSKINYSGQQYNSFELSSNGCTFSTSVTVVNNILHLLKSSILVYDDASIQFFAYNNVGGYTIDKLGIIGDFQVRGQLFSNHAATFSSTVTAYAFFQSSDENKKYNIFDLKQYSLEQVAKVQLKQYSFKGETLQKYGVIAQQLELYLPDLVNTNSEGEKTVDYISFLILRIGYLEDKLNKLESLLNK